MDLTDAEFAALYGAWQPLSFAETAALLDPLPWWVVGGWALELANGVPRPHHDLDVSVPRSALGALASTLSSYHLWAAQTGSLTPLARFDELPADHEQLWLRRDAQSPWLLDLLLQPIIAEDWVYKKDARVRVPLSRAVVSTGGVPHLAPEIALLHKAHLCRPQDDADLAATLPVLDAAARKWLRDTVRLALPTSPWVDKL